MDIQSSKIELVKIILNIENDKFIEKITEFIQKEKVDFWDEFSVAEQKEIEKGIKELNKGKRVALYPYDVITIYINANTGELINRFSKIETILGVGDTKYSGQRNFETQQISSNQFKLRDYTRGQGVETFNMNRLGSYTNSTDFIDNDNNWSSLEYNNPNKDNAALDSHWGTQKVYDYFLTKHNRISIDNLGFKLQNYVHANLPLINPNFTNNDNAFWDGSKMTYGDGSVIFSPLTSVDVVGHEIAHGLNSKTANMLYQGESGAINEGLSDIWGAMIEYFADPTKLTYLIGEEIKIGGGALRSMSNPNAYNQPNTYGGQYWYTGSGDNGGVHYNSGVFNHWFYILAEGKTGTNDLGNSFSVTGISKDKAAKIVYRAETVYFTSTTNYAQARDLTIQAAKDLYGANSVESVTVCQSWYAVGVGNNNCIVPVTITGNNVICSPTTNYTYNVFNLVPGSIVNWSVSTNALLLVSSTNTSLTVKPINATYNGIATITADVSGQITTKKVWIGKPLFTVTPNQYNPPTIIEIHAVGLNGVDISNEEITNITWELAPDNSGCGEIISNTGFDNEISYSTNPCITKLKITATNICGSTQITKSIVGSWQKGAAMITDDLKNYIIYPVPANDYLIVESLIDSNYQVSLFNNQALKVLNDSSIDGICNINVSNLQNGIYTLIIQSSQGNESNQIIINH